MKRINLCYQWHGDNLPTSIDTKKRNLHRRIMTATIEYQNLQMAKHFFVIPWNHRTGNRKSGIEANVS